MALPGVLQRLDEVQVSPFSVLRNRTHAFEIACLISPFPRQEHTRSLVAHAGLPRAAAASSTLGPQARPSNATPKSFLRSRINGSLSPPSPKKL
eukprot:1007220-Rhodomonas_salina.2